MEYFVYHFEKFLLVFSRVMGLFLTVSFFSSESIPDQIRMGIIFALTACIYPVVSPFVNFVPNNFVNYLFYVFSEAIIGASIGFIISILFSVYQLAGQYFTVQMGFGASEVFDPLSQISLPLMGQYIYMIFVLQFMIFRGPALILKALFDSFKMINFNDLLSKSTILSDYGLVSLITNLFIIGLKIALPVLGALLFVSITMGLLAKAAPQMNLLLIGFPISISVGFIILLLMTPILVSLIGYVIDYTFSNFWFLMKEMVKG